MTTTQALYPNISVIGGGTLALPSSSVTNFQTNVVTPVSGNTISLNSSELVINNSTHVNDFSGTINCNTIAPHSGSQITFNAIPILSSYTGNLFKVLKSSTANTNIGTTTAITGFTTSTYVSQTFGTWNSGTATLTITAPGIYIIGVRGTWSFSGATVIPGYICAGVNHSTLGVIAAHLNLSDDIANRHYNFTAPINMVNTDTLTCVVGSLETGSSSSALPNLSNTVEWSVFKIC